MRAPSVSHIALFTLLVWLCLPAVQLVAQTGGYSGSFTRMGFAPRGMAMGNALTSVHEHGSYGYYNPALSALYSETTQADLATGILNFDRRLHMVHVHTQLPPQAGISFSLLHMNVGNIDGRSQSGYHTGMFSTNEYQLLSNFGVRFTNQFWGGIGIKFNMSDFHPDLPRSRGVGVDAGFFAELSTRWSIGLAIYDLFASQRFDSSNIYNSSNAGSRTESYPLRIKAGTSYRPLEGWILSLDYEWQLAESEFEETNLRFIDGRPDLQSVRTGGKSHIHFFRFGSGYQIHELFTLRGGLQLHDLSGDDFLQPSAGFSLHLPFDRLKPSVDYAFINEPGGFSSIHMFSFNFRI